MKSLSTGQNLSSGSRVLLRSAGVLCLAAVGLFGSACGQKHGKYTSDHISQAQERMAILKSGTEWQMAQQQFLAGDLDKALKTVNRSLAINDNVPKSHVLKGRILIEKGRLEEARDSLLTAEKLDEKNVDAQYYLGIVHEQFNQPAEALARYNKAAELDTGNPQYVVAAAEMLVQTGDLNAAEQLLNSKREAFQYNAAVRQSLGHIAQLRGDQAAAAQCFSEALLLAPDDVAILEDLAQAQFQANMFADAEFTLNRLLDNPDTADRRDFKQMKSKCLIALNRPVEARTILLELTSDKESPRDFMSWVDLGNVSVVLKDKPHLRQAAMRAIGLQPDRHEGYTLRAMSHRIEGRSEEALTATDDAIKRCGGDIAPFVLRAMIQQDLGRPFDAKATLEQALARNPNSPGVRDMLARLDTQTGTFTSGEQLNQP